MQTRPPPPAGELLDEKPEGQMEAAVQMIRDMTSDARERRAQHSRVMRSVSVRNLGRSRISDKGYPSEIG